MFLREMDDASDQAGFGAQSAKYLVTQQDVDSFLALPAPRYVPPNIRRQRLGPNSALFAFLGPLLAAGGLVFGTFGSVLASGPWNDARIAPMIVGAVFVLVGALSGSFAWRYRLRNIRLLRRGILASAKLESIEATEQYVGYEQQHRARYRLDADGRRWSAECYFDEEIARRARRYHETNAPVRMLFDPEHPDRVLWAESLITSDENHELPPSTAETLVARQLPADESQP